MKINGYWHIMTRTGQVTKQRWICYADMARHANRVYGLNNWTYQWKSNREN